MKTDFESIAHLDFDVTEDKAPKCDGRERRDEYQLPLYGSRPDCPNTAQVLAFRNCCGIAEQLCLECYNWLSVGLEEQFLCKFTRSHRTKIPFFRQVVPIS